MVEINKEDRVVYNAGSNLEVSCIYQNTTTTGALGKGTGSDQKEKLTEAEQVGIYFYSSIGMRSFTLWDTFSSSDFALEKVMAADTDGRRSPI